MGEPSHDMSLSKQWDAHLLPAAGLPAEPLCTTGFCGPLPEFCGPPDCTSVGELTELRRLHFAIICFFIWSTSFVSLTPSGETEARVGGELGDASPLQWSGHGTISCRWMITSDVFFEASPLSLEGCWNHRIESSRLEKSYRIIQTKH